MNTKSDHISSILPGFVDYMSTERRYSPSTIEKYADNLRVYLRDVGDPRISEITMHDFITLKAHLARRGAGQSYVAGFIVALKNRLCAGILRAG